MNNFHKPEVQTVIFRYLTGLNLNWIKSYDTKCKKNPKNAKNTIELFFDKIAKKNEIEMFAFLSQPLSQLSFTPVKHLKMTV